MHEPARSAERIYPGLPSAAAIARQFVVRALADAPDHADSAAQIIAELFANAIDHTLSGRPGGVVGVRYQVYPYGARIFVHDQGAAAAPQARSADMWDEGGRGFMIMDALATHWGVYGDATGRVVWFELGKPDPD